MPIIGNIDLTRKTRKPSLFLATPNGTVIGKLRESYAVNRKVKLGSINELSFTVPYDVERKHEVVRNPIIDKIKDRYLIKHVLGDETEWYQIVKVSDSMDEDGDSRQIVAMLLPYELRDKLLRKYKAESKNCTTVLNEVLVGSNPLQPLTLWRVGYVDGSFDVMFRSFDVTSKSVLDFIFEIAETFGALIVWHTDTRTIDFRRPDLVGVNRGLKMSYGKYAKTINKDSITDEMTTRLKVFGKDDMSIQRLNPTGSNYLESFAYFLYPFQQDELGNVISKSDYMSDDLCKAILAYEKKVQEISGDFTSYASDRAELVTQRSAIELELIDLENEMAQIEDRIDIQHAQETISYQIKDHTGPSKTYSFKMNGGTSGRKFAIMAKIVNTSGLTLKYAGSIKPIVDNTWTVVAKKSVSANATTSDSVLVEGSTSTKVHVLVVEISSFEYSGVTYEGIKVTSNGAAPNSAISSTDLEVDWSAIQIGQSVYVKRNASEDWKFDGTQLLGIVASDPVEIDDLETGDVIGWEVTLDRAVTAGDYGFGYTFVGDNSGSIIDRYSIDNKQMEIDSKNSEITVINNSIKSIDDNISILRDSIKIENFFVTQELRNERNQFIIEKEWVDTNYINDQDLYEAALKKFEQIKSPQTVIKLDVVNFLEIVEAQRDWDKLVLGDTITIVYEKIGINVQAKIIEIEYNYENGDINLTIANVKDIETDEEKLIKMLYNAVSTSVTVDTKKFDWDGASRDISEMQALIEGQWDAAKRAIVAGVNESVVIDARGITITDPNDPLTFLRATHGVLGITNDGGNSFKHAITGTGIVAERLYGQIIMGQALTLGDADGIFKIIGNKATVSDRASKEVIKLGLYDETDGDKFGLVLLHDNHIVKMDRDEGFKIEKKNGDGTYSDVVWLDASGNLNLNNIIATGTIEATTIKAGVKLTVGNINVGNLITDISEGLQTFQDWIKGSMIEVNTISATKIKTSELIVGDNISMGPNARISWSAVTSKPADLAYTGDITWTRVKSTVISGGGIDTPHLNANIVTSDILSANAITSKHTITGATLQTATSGARVVIDSSGLKAYNSLGTAVIDFSTSSGSATFRGNISGGASINVTTNATIGNLLMLNGDNYGAGIEWRAGGSGSKYASIYIDPSGAGMFLTNSMAGGGIYAGSQRIDVAPVAVFG